MRDQAAPAIVDAEYVLRRLDDAGTTLMALPAKGCFPQQIRSSMPDPIRSLDPDARNLVNVYQSAGQTQLRMPPPSGSDISAMEEVYFSWMPLLPWTTEQQRRKKRIVLLRSLNWPHSERDDPHVWSWRRLAASLGIHRDTVQAWHARTIDELVSRLRRVPRPCAETMARIAGARSPDWARKD